MNRIFATIALIFFIPILIIVSVLIWFEDGLPIFFKQKRVGRGALFFKIYKFRTMKKDTPNVATHLLDNPEQYILKVGRVLRKLSLDEIPNLFNIIKGDMGFIGPRPALYNQHDLIQMRKDSGIDKMLPGITGWAQINGRDEISLDKKVELEREYMEKKSFRMDIEIIFKTFFAVFFNKNIKH